MSLRVAFIGASGTGKTTLATYLAESRELPLNPVGSRSVAKAMGFESPYDVDKAGRRAEFQRRLVTEKRAWEDAHEDFVSDRTTCDNLAYTTIHDVHAVDATLLGEIVAGMHRYTHVVYCPVDAFCDPAGDPSRVADMTYHRLYDAVVAGLIEKFFFVRQGCGVYPTILPEGQKYLALWVPVVERKQWLDLFLGA